MSIVLILHKMNLTARKNNAQADLLRYWDSKRDLLTSAYNSGITEDVFIREKQLDSDMIQDSSELMAINAELNAIDNANLNLFA